MAGNKLQKSIWSPQSHCDSGRRYPSIYEVTTEMCGRTMPDKHTLIDIGANCAEGRVASYIKKRRVIDIGANDAEYLVASYIKKRRVIDIGANDAEYLVASYIRKRVLIDIGTNVPSSLAACFVSKETNYDKQ
jgi:hypothetical protein